MNFISDVNGDNVVVSHDTNDLKVLRYYGILGKLRVKISTRDTQSIALKGGVPQ